MSTAALCALLAPAGVLAGQDPAPADKPLQLFVAPDGDDAHAGTADAPLRTLARAQHLVRDYRRQNHPAVFHGAQILLRGGVYPLAETLRFRPADSGTALQPTVITSAPGEQAILSGGVALDRWQKLQENVAGLSPAAAGRVWVATPPLIDGNVPHFRQLWVAGQKAVRARTPNGSTCEQLVGWDRGKEQAVISAKAVSLLGEAAGVEMMLQQQWEIAVLRLKQVRVEGDRAFLSFREPESHLEFTHPWPQPILPPQGGGAFYLTNALEFLDSPGEWYQDAATGRVYYWPREGEDLARDSAVAPVLESLLEVQGTLDRPVAYITFQNIGFEHTTWMRPSEMGHVPLQAGMPLVEAYKLSPHGTDYHSPGLDNQAWIARIPAAVSVGGAHHITIEGCRFGHTAASGLDIRPGTHDDLIQGNIFRDIGGNGIQVGSFQDGPVEVHFPYDPLDDREICTKERIANNVIADAANEDWGCVGIIAGYVRETTIEHNDIGPVSYTGISVGWGWKKKPNCMHDNRIHANYLRQVATRMCDTAGIYTLSVQPHTVVDENRVDAITMSPYVDRKDHWFYLYTDEGSSFMTVRDNWCPAEKFLQNANGPGNLWQNNGPKVSDAIKAAAGLEPAYRHLLETK